MAAVKEDPSKNSATLGLGTTTKQLPTKPEKALPKQPRRTASTATKKQRPTTSTSATTTALEEWDAYDIVWPLSNHSTLGLQQLETPDKDGITLLVQLDPDCPIPEFVGAVGAVGRLEATADHRGTGLSACVRSIDRSCVLEKWVVLSVR